MKIIKMFGSTSWEVLSFLYFPVKYSNLFHGQSYDFTGGESSIIRILKCVAITETNKYNVMQKTKWQFL